MSNLRAEVRRGERAARKGVPPIGNRGPNRQARRQAVGFAGRRQW